MKRRKMITITISILLALSLGSSGLITAMAYLSPTGFTSEDITPVSPYFTTQPTGQNATVGQDVVFSVEANGSPSPALQWQVSSNGGGTWTNIDGQTRPYLRLNSVSLNQNGNQYRVVATSTSGERNSNAATLIVNAITNTQVPNIIVHPVNGTILVDGSITLSVAADVTDRGTLSYQWFSSTTDSNTGGTLISGATARTFSPPTNREGTTFYFVVVTSTNNYASGSRTASVASNTARVAVTPLVNTQAPYISNQPEGDVVTLNGHTLLSVAARTVDNGTLSYQWFISENGSNTGGTAVNGATGAVFAPPTDTLGVTYYYVVITNTNNSVSGAASAAVSSDAVAVSVITTPGAPLNLTTVISDNNLVLRWETPEDDGGSEITGFQVSDNIVTIWIEANGENEHTFYSLSYDREYTLRVRAINAAGSGEEAELMATTPERETINVEGVAIENDNLYIYVGDYVTLDFTISPADANEQSVRWSSGDTSVAVVNRSGRIAGIAPGTAVITVTTIDGGHTASITVTVLDNGSNHFLWIGLGALAPLGTGTGIYFWRRNKKRR